MFKWYSANSDVFQIRVPKRDSTNVNTQINYICCTLLTSNSSRPLGCFLSFCPHPRKGLQLCKMWILLNSQYIDFFFFFNCHLLETVFYFHCWNLLPKSYPSNNCPHPIPPKLPSLAANAHYLPTSFHFPLPSLLPLLPFALFLSDYILIGVAYPPNSLDISALKSTFFSPTALKKSYVLVHSSLPCLLRSKLCIHPSWNNLSLSKIKTERWEAAS